MTDIEQNPALQTPQIPHPDPYMEEDEINLLDLMLVLVKHKWLIIGMVFITGVAAVFYSLSLTNIYRSEATVGLRPEKKATVNPLSALGGLGGIVAGQLGLGGGGSLEKLEVVLQSRNLTNRIINKYNLMPIIFADDWNAAKKTWRTDKPPTLQDGWKAMQGLLQVKLNAKQSTLMVGIEHEDPQKAKQFTEYYITELSETLRQEVLRDAAENMRFYREQLSRTSDSFLKEKLYALLANEIETETFARAQKYYGFLVLDPPIVPDPDKKVKPKRSVICMLSVVVAFFTAVFIAFLIEFIQRIKAEDPERYRQMIQGLKIWQRH
ncbi:Wzz/FepE/Etk N-terminal domain-containing protein [Thermodesulfobacteriota bacterium]